MKRFILGCTLVLATVFFSNPLDARKDPAPAPIVETDEPTCTNPTGCWTCVKDDIGGCTAAQDIGQGGFCDCFRSGSACLGYGSCTYTH